MQRPFCDCAKPVSSASAQQLIPSSQWTKFVATYVFVTVILWVFLGAFFSFSFVIPDTTARVTLDAIVTGLAVGGGQWLVLRTYLPDWFWIVATAVGSGLVTLTQSLWYFALLQTIQQPDSDRFLNIFLNIFLNTPLSIILPVQVMTVLAFCLWFAGAQWLVLRRSVKATFWAAFWWLLTPAIALVLVWVSLILQLLFFFSVVLQQQVLLPGLLAATQALMLCRFQRQEPDFTDAVDPIAPSAISFIGLVVATIAGVLILSLSLQGFLIWLKNW